MAKTIVRYRNRSIKKKSRRRAKMTLPISVMAPIGVLGVQTAKTAISDPVGGMNYLTGALTGYRPDWKEKGWKPFHAERLKSGAIPILIGLLVHKIAGKTGVNRALGRAGVPWIRI